MGVQKSQKARIPKRFYFITALFYVPAFFVLALLHARWYGWLWTGLSFCLLLWLRSNRVWRGLNITLCFALVFCVALNGIYAARPQKEVSFTGQLGRELLRLVLRLPVEANAHLDQALDEKERWQPAEGYLCQTVHLSQSKLELLWAEKSESQYAVLQLHGGAFEGGLINVYRSFAQRYGEMIQGGMVATLDYRLWPAHGYPAQQQDTLEAWRYLTETLQFAPERIIVVGDSAGGNLALTLGLHLRDSGEPMPGAIICMSPWADLSNSGPSHITNATVDPTFGVPAEFYDGTPVGVSTTYTQGWDTKNPYMSPSFGDYKGFPQMLLQAAGTEVLLSDSQMVYENARKNGVDCHFTIYEGLFHVFQASLDLIPESRTAWGEINAFIQSVMDEK